MLEIYKFECFTAPCEIQLYCDNKTLADGCSQDILKEVKRLELKYNYFDSNSYLSKLNKRETNIIDNETKTLLSYAKQFYKKTDNLFDITIATLKDSYNLNTLKELEDNKKDLVQYVGSEHFEVKKNKLYFDNDFTKIDFGGVVKEYSADKAVSIIKKYKIKSALVNFGGDIFALGKKPNGSKYSIGITNPKQTSEKLFSVEIENQALTTSASYERYITIEDKQYSHIISKDKKTTDILSATVISSSCLQSGVFSTALMIDKNIKTLNKIYLIDTNLEIIS